jgi:hypothetical protein
MIVQNVGARLLHLHANGGLERLGALHLHSQRWGERFECRYGDHHGWRGWVRDLPTARLARRNAKTVGRKSA